MDTYIREARANLSNEWDRESNIRLIQNLKSYYEERLHNKLERHGAILYAIEIIVGLYKDHTPYFLAKDYLGISISLENVTQESRISGFDDISLPKFCFPDVVVEFQPKNLKNLYKLFRYLGEKEPDAKVENYYDAENLGPVVRLTIKEKSQYQKEDYENVFKVIQSVE